MENSQKFICDAVNMFFPKLYSKQVTQLTLAEFEQMSKGAKVLSRNKKFNENKVVLTPDGIILKMYRLKRVISSAFFNPYAKRFVDNVKRLNEKGIRSVEIKDVYYIGEHKRYIVAYYLLEGISLREFLQQNPDDKAMLPKVIKFINELHDKGIYFRAVHFGNIIILPEGEFALIDLATVSFGKKLNAWQRARNFRSILRYQQDYQNILRFGVKDFFQQYLSEAKFSHFANKVFQFFLLRYSPQLREKL